MIFAYIALLLAGYLLGSIHAGYLLPKWLFRIDIREHGTGKIGASNVMRVTAKWMAVPVMLCDVGKGALAVWLAQLAGLEGWMQVTVGLAAIIGHNWPVFLGFKGGRGVFTSLGVITMISPWIGLIMLVVPYLFAPVKQVALGVFLVVFSLPFLSWFFYEPFGVEDRLGVTLGFILLSLIVFGTRVITPRTALSANTSNIELFFNRLFLDRDIKDAKAWHNHKKGDDR
ncbi:MAG: glycerol-3-phosphate acyltransferase [Dehalococcoidales bacterium]